MYGLSHLPAHRTCQLCPTPVSNYAKYCPRCSAELRHTRKRIVYTVLQQLEHELPRLMRQMQEAHE